MIVAIGAVDWDAVAEAMRRGGDDAMGRIEAADPGRMAVAIAVLSIGWSVHRGRGALSGVSGDGAALVDLRVAFRRA